MLIRLCESGVPDVHVQFAIAVELKDAFGRARAEEREVPRFGVARILQAVEAPPDVSEAERADQPLRDVIAFDDGQRGIGGYDFQPVVELEASQLQARGFVAEHLLEANESLFEDRRRVLPSARREV